MSSPSPVPSAVDRYEATFVVSLDPSKGDFTSLQEAINALPPSGGKIFVKAGIYPITSTIKITSGNVHIQGEGMGITRLVAKSTMTGNTPALQAFSTVSDGTPRALMADTKRGDLSVSVSSTDAASFAAGDYVLLYSDKVVDTEAKEKHAGELKRITSVDAGRLTFDDQIFDAYTLADKAHVTRVTVLSDITLSDFSITTLASTSGLKQGFTHIRFVENLQIERIEVGPAYFAGIHLQSVRNSTIAHCYIHHIGDVQNVKNERYGVLVGCASQNIAVGGCRFANTRHAVTTGGSGGTNLNGVQRNIVVSNCTSMHADTAHFDTHQPAENVVFNGCVAIGGTPFPGSSSSPPTNEVIGFQMRGMNCSIVGCSVLQAVGKGIMFFGPNSSNGVISGNMIANVSAITDSNGKPSGGIGIYFDSDKTSSHSVTGNVIKNCDGSAIIGVDNNNDIVIQGNVIENVNTVVSGSSIRLKNASRVLIAANNISSIAKVTAVEMKDGSDDWRIVNNHLGSAGVVLTGFGSMVTGNYGYNPVGVIANPWPSTGTELVNKVPSGNATPRSGTTYTVRHTPKTILVNGGDVTAIMINGAVTGITKGTFKLGVGETIAINYSATAPSTLVFAE